MAQFYAVQLPRTGFGQIPDAAAAEIAHLRRQLRAAKQVEVALIAGGAALTVATLVLQSKGYKQEAVWVTIAGAVSGAIFAGLRLFEEDTML